METKKLLSDQVVTGAILPPDEVLECVQTALHLCETIQDRQDLHERGMLERFHDILMGEVAERSVIKWLHAEGKEAVSAVDKTSGRPDPGHDILLTGKKGQTLKCSVKSSISGYHSELDKILDTFSMATKRSEICDINIQVYFWLRLGRPPRVAVPSEYNMAIIGWQGRKDLERRSFGHYATEKREVPEIKLRDIRPMGTLLGYLK